MIMNNIIFLMRQSLLCPRKLYNLLLTKKLHNLSSNPNTNLVLGLLPLLPTVYAQNDVPNNKSVENNKTSTASLREPQNKLPVRDDRKDERTGWERVCAVYERDEFGNLSKELSAVSQSTFYASFLGTIYGGITRSREAYIDFMERNQASIFDSPFDAKRRLQNHVTMHFMKGGCHWAVKVASFTGGFMLFLVTVGAYRGYYSILDYTLSGIVIGSVLKFRNGPPALIVGGTVGGMLGAFCGSMTNLLLYFQDSTLDDMLSFQYEIEKRRHQLYLDAKKRSEEGLVDSSGLELVKSNDKKEIKNPTI